MLYKFTYFSNDRLVNKLCTTEREAEVLFDILVSAHIEFRVFTIPKRRSIYD